MHKYEIIIYWSDEDNVFVADIPELPGCMAHGDSHEEALAQAQVAIALWLEAADEIGRPIPQPAGDLVVPQTFTGRTLSA
jgi:predicted RNase H-like HicB family nuclease